MALQPSPNRIPARRPFAGRALAAICAPLALCACMTPDFVAPPVVQDIASAESYASASVLPEAPATASASAWWREIGGEELDRLVDRLLDQNLDLQIAQARIDQARALRAQARGALLPSINASASGSDTLSRGDSATTTIPGGGTISFGNSSAYSAGLDASWDVDLFGELRSGARAADLSLRATELQQASTAQLLVAELARAWVGAAALQRRLDLQRSIADSYRTTSDLTDQRYRDGSETTSAADVEITRANLASAEARIPEIEAQLQIQSIAIDTLLARRPGTTRAELDAIALPERLPAPPVGLPGALLTRRPDVAAAELQFRAALEDVGAARARLFPGLSLTSSLTFRGTDPEDVFDWDSHIASLAGSLTAPIFQGGRLRAQLRAEQAAAREQAASYAATALGAVADVESALLLEAAYRAQAERLETNVEAAGLADELSQNRYRQGLSSLLTVLEAQRSLNSARESLILAEQAWLQARIDLYLALGGDWTPGADTMLNATTAGPAS